MKIYNDKDYDNKIFTQETRQYSNVKCCVCFGDLSTDYEDLGTQYEAVIDKQIKDINWSIGNMHDELLKMNYISYYDTLPTQAKDKIQNHDYKIVSQYLQRKERFIVEVGADIDENNFKILKQQYPYFIFKHSLTKISNNPLLLANIAAVQNYIACQYNNDCNIITVGELMDM